MRFRAVGILTLWVVFQSHIYMVKGAEALPDELVTARDLHSSTTTIFIDETTSPWGSELFQDLFLLLISTAVPENTAITLREKRVSKNNMSEILLLCNNEIIGGARIYHLQNGDSSENANKLYRQFVQFRNRNNSRFTH